VALWHQMDKWDTFVRVIDLLQFAICFCGSDNVRNIRIRPLTADSKTPWYKRYDIDYKQLLQSVKSGQ